VFGKKRSLQGTLDKGFTLKSHLQLPVLIRLIKPSEISKCPEIEIMVFISSIGINMLAFYGCSS
jgi:hypothetical protein